MRSLPPSPPSSCSPARGPTAGRRSGAAGRGASATSLIGTRRHRPAGGLAEARQRIEDALLEELGADGFSLRVIAGDDDALTVRGEVDSLDLIRRASEVIDRSRGGADVVNLIRLRAPSGGGALAT